MKELGPTTGTGKSLADAKRALSEVTDWIAQLSPAELAAPSCYAEKGTTLRARFTTVASAGCRPLVRPNYGYFNAALPRSAPQVVIITRHQALLRHRRQVQPRRQLPESLGVPRQSRAGRDDGQGRDPRLAALSGDYSVS